MPVDWKAAVAVAAVTWANVEAPEIVAPAARSEYGPVAEPATPLAWLGVAVFIIGVTLVKGYETERDVRMAPGEKTTLGGYEFTFLGTKEVPGPNYMATQGQVEVRRAGSRASKPLAPSSPRT